MTTPHESFERALVWLRRDLRLSDHTSLLHALRSARQVWVAFIFDSDILCALPRQDRRVEFLVASVHELNERLHPHGSALLVRHGSAREELPRLAAVLGVQAVYCSHDDEPFALARDAAVAQALREQGAELRTVKDHVIFERSEVLTQAGRPYTVFTPYKRAWLARLKPFDTEERRWAAHAHKLAAPPQALPGSANEPPSLAALGFERTNLSSLALPTGESGAQALLQDFAGRLGHYGQRRDFPAAKGPSYLSTHLRFGTLSIRQAARLALAQGHDEGAQTWLSELIWRDFYHQVMHHHPHAMTSAFKPEYDSIAWEHGPAAEALFAAWCEGRTGYPLVDAAMAQINQSGYMHNRLRMVVASFLTKDLGLDWRWGEAYFATHLNDFDLAANNGGWQWAASSGCDAQPYFRIFNPVSQSEKFDGAGQFIRRYLPQLAQLPDAALHAPWLARPVDLAAAGVVLGQTYPWPVVMHDQARATTLTRYAVVKAGR
jgi:deoxyribodipyrimidine photo-lyase